MKESKITHIYFIDTAPIVTSEVKTFKIWRKIQAERSNKHDHQRITWLKMQKMYKYVFMLGSNWLIYTLIQPQTFGSLSCGSDLDALSKLQLLNVQPSQCK